MTPEDAQIDILLRRYARRAEGSPAAEHLDADELNAFAEDAVPAAARSRYMSHLADCSDCRQLVSQLAMSSGAAVRASSATAPEARTDSWRQRRAAFFRPPTLRYAGFALVLIAAAATVFVVMRRPHESRLLAQNESLKDEPGSFAKQAEAPQRDQSSAGSNATPAAPQSAQNLKTYNKQEDSTAGAVPASPPKPAAGTVASAVNPALAKEDTKRAATEPTPGFAPPPPAEAERQAQDRLQREPKSVGGLGGGQKSEADKLKTMDQQRAAEFGKDRRAGPNDNSNQRNQQAVNQNTLSGITSAARNEPATTTRPGRNEEVAPAARPAGSADRDDAEKASETRSAGGHKFRRQGNIWVDAKYKSSMPIVDVSRDSDEYRALGSAVKSIVAQLGSGVILVSKGKAYRIK